MESCRRWKVSDCHVHEYVPPSVMATGIGYLDHMIDQFYSHAQIGVSVQVLDDETATTTDTTATDTATDTTDTTAVEYINRHAHTTTTTTTTSSTTTTNTTDHHQSELLAVVGTHIGRELRRLWIDTSRRRRCRQDNQNEEEEEEIDATNTTTSSTFACPLDEALTICIIEASTITTSTEHHHPSPLNNDDTATTTGDDDGALVTYTLPPYGHYPVPTGRTQIGALRTAAIVSFWNHLARASGFTLSLTKIRGHNAHHIVESSFKAFARALRNLLDGVDTTAMVLPVVPKNISNNSTATEIALNHRYGRDSPNDQASRALQRSASIQRNTKETSIRTQLDFDGGIRGIHIDTGIETLNQFLTTFATYASLSLHVTCTGDLHIDEHHTAEDVAISIGQVLNEALGDKAGLNRMWSCPETTTTTTGPDATRVLVVMDLSNRPCLTHNLSSSPVLEHLEMIGDLSCEMFEHVLESIVVNARMTVHIVLEHAAAATTPVAAVTNHHHHHDEKDLSSSAATDLVQALARGLGQSLKYCAVLDGRRAGATASSKGTLSV